MDKTLVVFIHGFIDKDTTWHKLIQHCKLDSELRAAADFDTFDYSRSTTANPKWLVSAASWITGGRNRLVKNATSIDDVALTLAQRLRSGVWKQYARVVLVGHSTGGLVARSCTLKMAEPVSRISKLGLIAVPNEGTHLASLAKRFTAGNQQLKELSINSEFIQGLNKAWNNTPPLNPEHIRYYVGDRDRIVPPDSACAGALRAQIYPILAADHNTIFDCICEPESFPFLKELILDAGVPSQSVPGSVHVPTAAESQSGSADPLDIPGLPADTTTFIGRERELRELHELLVAQRQRLVTIAAPGGYGKTRIAIELGRRVSGQFDDGVQFIRLEALRLAPAATAEQAAETLASAAVSALGQKLQPQGGTAPEQLCAYLQGVQVLLVFDNFEHVLRGAGLLTQIRESCEGVQIVVTSRDQLGLRGEEVYRFEGFEKPDEAVALFVDSAPSGALNLPVDEEQIKAVCAALHNVPLAVIQAAAWADVIPLGRMLADLQQLMARTDMVVGDQAHDLNVRASNDWSWGLLEPEQRETLMRLSVFRGGGRQDDSAAVLGEADLDTAAWLAVLRRRSWLKLSKDKQRWDFINASLRDYAAKKLREEGGAELETAAWQRHAQHFATLSGELSPLLETGGRQEETYQRFNADSGNFNAACELSLETQDADLLPGLEDGFLSYLFRTGSYSACLDLLEWVLAVKQAVGNERGAAQTLTNMGIIHSFRGDYNRALELHEQSLEVKRQVGDEHSAALTLTNMGVVHQSRGDYDLALDLYAQSLEVFRRLRDERGTATTLNNMGNVHYSHGDYDRALKLYAQSLEVDRSLGNGHGVVMTLTNMANIYSSHGQYDRALMLYAQSLEVFRRLEDRYGVALILNNMANIHCFYEQYDQALELYAQSLEVKRGVQDEHGAAQTLNNMGVVYEQQGKFAATHEAWTEAETKYRGIGLTEEADKVAGWLAALPEE